MHKIYKLLVTLFLVSYSASTAFAGCTDYDFSGDIQTYVDHFQDFKDRFDLFDTLPTIVVSGISAKGQKCDCCDGSKSWNATISGTLFLDGQVPTPVGRTVKFNGSFFGYTAYASADIGITIEYKASTTLSGTYSKSCNKTPCFSVSGTFTDGEISGTIGGQCSATLKKGTAKRGGYIIFHEEADVDGTITAHLSGSLAYDTCGAGFKGSIHFGDITGHATVKIPLPGGISNYNLDSPDVVLIKGQSS